MSEQVTIARPYAEAAFSLAREQNALPQWAEMLKVASNVASDSTVRAALDNPKLDNAAKESLRAQVSELAVAGAEKILKREVDAKAHADLLSALEKQL